MTVPFDGILGQLPLAAAHRLRQADHGTVGLELRERRLQQLTRTIATDLGDEVDGHVVGGAEAGAQRVGARGSEPADDERIQATAPQDDAVSFDVDAAPAGTTGELGVFRGGELGVGVAVVFDEFLQDDRARGHVDPEGQGLGGEHRPDPALGEQLLDDLAEGRQHPGVVGREAPFDAVDEVPVAQDAQVLVGQGADPLLDIPPVADTVRLADEPDPPRQQLPDSGIAPVAAEHERDRRQQPFAVEGRDDVSTGGSTTGPYGALPPSRW